MPRCGNCKGSHPTVADVRACYSSKHPVAERPESGKPQWPASEKQVAYVLGLYKERDLPPNHTQYTADRLRLMERDDVSSEINLLKTYPHAVRYENGKQRKEWSMPAGRYALYHEAGPGVGTGKWRFYQVDKPTKGKWDGYTFIKQLIGAPGNYRQEPIRREQRDALLQRIEDDPKKAMADFGFQSGHCGKCSSPLTNPESLQLGIGPVCRGKMGW